MPPVRGGGSLYRTARENKRRENADLRNLIPGSLGATLPRSPNLQRSQHTCHLFEADRLHVLGDGVALRARVHNKALVRLHILTSHEKALLRASGQTTFYFDGPKPVAGNFQRQIDFRPGGRAI